MICRGLCACTEMLWMCVLYVSFGSKVRPRTFGCVAMGSAFLFIVRSRLLVYSAGSGLNLIVVLFMGHFYGNITVIVLENAVHNGTNVLEEYIICHMTHIDGY